MLRQADGVGLVTFDKKVRKFIPARSTSKHLSVIYDALEKTKAEILHPSSANLLIVPPQPNSISSGWAETTSKRLFSCKVITNLSPLELFIEALLLC